MIAINKAFIGGGNGGEKAILSTKTLQSRPLRHYFSACQHHRNKLYLNLPQHLLKSYSYKISYIELCQAISRCSGMVFLFIGGGLVVVLPPFLTSGFGGIQIKLGTIRIVQRLFEPPKANVFG